METPSFYDSINMDFIKQRSRITKLVDKTVRFPDRKKEDLAPTLYSPTNLLLTASPRFTLAKTARNNFVEKYTKNKAIVPAPNTYHPEKAEKYVTLGMRRSYK